MALASHRVIVKQLDAVQNLGAMDVLCTDKTGTLTLNEVRTLCALHGTSCMGVGLPCWSQPI